MDAATLNALLQLLPNLSAVAAAGIRDLLTYRGYDLDRLLSTGQQINEQNITHLDMEIRRVEALLTRKGGDPVTTAIPQEAASTEVKKPAPKK